MNHHAKYRLEIHACENGQWFSSLWLSEVTQGQPIWESRYHEDMDDAYSAGKYEMDERAEQDREAYVMSRESLRQPVPDEAREVGMANPRHWS